MKAVSPRKKSPSEELPETPSPNGHHGRASHKPTRHQTLDPFGIYGTRTAQRIRASRRRRLMQNVMMCLLLAALVGIFLLATRVPRTPAFSSVWQTSLMVTPSAAPIWASDGQGGALLVPTENGSLLSVDISSGKEQQILSTAFPLRAQPVIVSDAAFVPCEDGTLYVVGWRTRQRMWSYRSGSAMTARPALTKVLMPGPTPTPIPSVPLTGPTAQPGQPVAGSADRAVEGVRPLATTASRPAPGATNAGATSVGTLPVTALSPLATPPTSTPSPLATPGSTAAGSISAPVVVQPTPKPVPKLVIFTGNDSGTVAALEAGNGRLIWRRNAGAPVGNGLTAVSGVQGRSLVLVPLLGGLATRGGLWCLDARTGAPLWRFPKNNKAYAAQLPAPAVEITDGGAAGRVYCVDDGGAVFCLDLLTGRWDKGKGWKTFVQPLSSADKDAAAVLRGEPLVWGKCLILGGNDGGVRCFDTGTGQLKWTFDAGAAVRSRPQVVRWGSGPSARHVALVGCDGPTIYALDVEAGTPVARFRVDGRAFAEPVVLGRNLLALTSDGNLQRFQLPE